MSFLSGITDIASDIGLGDMLGYGDIDAQAQAQKSAAQTREMQQEYGILKQQTTEAHDARINLENNQATMAQRGLSTLSPSFSAIQLNTLRNTQVALTEGNTAMKIAKYSLQDELASIDAQAEARKEQTTIQTGMQIASLIAMA